MSDPIDMINSQIDLLEATSSVKYVADSPPAASTPLTRALTSEGEMCGLTVSTFVEGFHDTEAVRKMKYRDLGETGMKVRPSLPARPY